MGCGAASVPTPPAVFQDCICSSTFRARLGTAQFLQTKKSSKFTARLTFLMNLTEILQDWEDIFTYLHNNKEIQVK